MATCLSSGLPPAKALELSAGTSRSPRLRRVAQAARAACERGEPLSHGFMGSARDLPEYFVPVIQAGELTGRHVESYQLIHEHLERIKPSLDLVRKSWLYPLICISVGWGARAGLFLYFGLYGLAGKFIGDTFLKAAVGFGIGWAVLRTPWGKLAADWLLLQLPFIRESLVRAAVVLFMGTFRLAYEAGGLSVLAVLDVALATVGNQLIRADLAKARAVLEAQGSFEEAFAAPTMLSDAIKSSIAAGAMSGHLGTSLAQIVQAETLTLETTLETFNRVFQRLVGYGVAMSVVGTLLMCLTYSSR